MADPFTDEEKNFRESRYKAWLYTYRATLSVRIKDGSISYYQSAWRTSAPVQRVIGCTSTIGSSFCHTRDDGKKMDDGT